MNLRKNEDIIDKLKDAVSPQYLEKVLFNKLLPRCSKLNEKHNNNRLTTAFKKWRKIKEVDDVKKLQFKVLHKMKNHKVSDLLRKKLQFWKNNKAIESKVYPNSVKVVMYLNRHLTNFEKL